jgi:p-cumate 2,3-dioxygenase beta subunit
MASQTQGFNQTNAVTREEIEDFLYYEADLLDNWRLDDWGALFTDDCQYVVPTTDKPDGDPRRDVVFIDDDIVRLKGRITRLKSRHAHREYPWSRTRRFISNVRLNGVEGNEYLVSANFIVYRVRDENAHPLMGRYDYRLRRDDGSFKIVYRRATLDLEAMRDHGAVSIIL